MSAAPRPNLNRKAGRPTWQRPDDLRERMLAATRSGTNLDPNPASRAAAAKKAPQTEEERKAKARIWARENRARQKAERLQKAAATAA